MATKLLLLGFGSRGDVQPLLPLSVGLCEAGYEVKIAAGSNFKGWIESRGIQFVDVGIDMQELMNSDSAKEWIENSSGSSLQEAQNMKRIFDEYTAAAGDEILRISQEADVLISNLPTFGVAHSVAQLLGKKHIRIMLAPLTPTTNADAMLVPLLPQRDFFLHRYYGYIGIYFMHWMSKDATNSFRRKHGQPPLRFGDFARAWNRMPILYGVSPYVMPRDPKWHKDIAVTGFWFDEPDLAWQPPAPLADFLHAHPSPVYVGFGSMATKNPQATLRMMVDALRQSGQAGMIYSGWAGLRANELPDNILLIDGAPHDWLFPRMAALVHHGGAGTTAAGLRAGVPATVVAHMADQPYWGRRIYELGAGHKPIPRHELSAERLTEAITAMINSPVMKANAAELGAKIRQEKGVANAVEAVDGILSG
jgi:UDP:flavonoid glycosyltransferase YjiC (YdhE family)